MSYLDEFSRAKKNLLQFYLVNSFPNDVTHLNAYLKITFHIYKIGVMRVEFFDYFLVLIHIEEAK